MNDPDDPSVVPALRFLRPELPPLEEVAAYFKLAQDARRFSNFGPCHELFAARLAEAVGRQALCVPVANCTLGLMVALRALTSDQRPRKQLVAAPSYTFAATPLAIAWSGFTPLFVDVDPESWHVDVESLTRAIDRHGDELAAVVACSTFGTAPPIAQRNGWEAACRTAGVPLVVDSAAGWGSLDETDSPLGMEGDAEVFSFHATKSMAIGEGGVIVTRDRELHDRLRRLVNFGFDRAGGTLTEEGLNAKMSEIVAATGLAALDRHERVLAARRTIATAVRSRLKPGGFAFQHGFEQSALPAINVLAPEKAVRDLAMTVAKERSIELRSYYDSPMHRSAAFAKSPRADDLSVTNDLASRALSLPIADAMSESEIDAVVDCLGAASA